MIVAALSKCMKIQKCLLNLAELCSIFTTLLCFPYCLHVFRVTAFNVQKNVTVDTIRAEKAKNRNAICFEYDNGTNTERETDLTARHYGCASFSFPKLLRSLLGSSKRGNLTECGVLAAVLIDRVHPTSLGRVLLADVLILYLTKAREYYQTNKAQLQQQGPSRQRVRPLHPKSVIVPRMTCYGSGKTIGHIRSEYISDPSLADLQFDPESPLPVSNFSNGWMFVEEEHGKKNPGWISHTPGSVLKMTVQVEKVSSDIRQTIGISYLTSYENMGTAAVSCLEGCQCPDAIMDGHEGVYQQSVPKMKDIPLEWTASSESNATLRNCEIQVQILNTTYSEGHKFKVLQLVVQTWVNISDILHFFRLL